MAEKHEDIPITRVAAVREKYRALTPLFGNGAGAFRIGKNSVVSTKIGKKYNILCMKFLCQTDITYKQTKQTETL